MDLLGFFSFLLLLPPRPLPNNLVVILIGDLVDVIVEWATGADGSRNDEQLRPMRDVELAKSQAAATNCNL